MLVPEPSLTSREKAAIALIFILVLVFFAQVTRMHFYTGYGDDAINAQLVESISHTGRPASDLLFSVSKDTIPLLSQPAAVVAHADLTSHDYHSLNYFHFHFYAIVYLYAYLARIVPIDALLPFLYALSYVGMLALVYMFLRRKQAPVVAAILFCGLITLHPAWSLTLFGQYYNDRLFVLIGFAFFSSLDCPTPSYRRIIVSGVLCLLIVEKCGYIAGAFALSYTILHWTRIRRSDRIRYAAIGVAMVSYSYVIVKFYINATWAKDAYDGYLSHPLYFLSNPVALDDLRVFLTVNLPLILIFGVFDWRAMIIGLCALIPNICGNIGGAEKTGWVTHYHAMYFPVYVWAAASGYAKLCRLLRSARATLALAAVAAAMGIFFATINPDRPARLWPLPPARTADICWVAAFRSWKDMFDPQGFHAFVVDRTRWLQKAVPEGTSVSCPEGVMPALYHDRKIDLYPIGVDNDDAVIMAVDESQSGLHRYCAMVSYLSKAEDRKSDDAILARMGRLGFDLRHPAVAAHLAIFRRKRPVRTTYPDPGAPERHKS